MDLLNVEARALGSTTHIKAMVGNYTAAPGIVATGAVIAILLFSLMPKRGIRTVALNEEWNDRQPRLCWRENRLRESRSLTDLIEFLLNAHA